MTYCYSFYHRKRGSSNSPPVTCWIVSNVVIHFPTKNEDPSTVSPAACWTVWKNRPAEPWFLEALVPVICRDRVSACWLADWSLWPPSALEWAGTDLRTGRHSSPQRPCARSSSQPWSPWPGGGETLSASHWGIRSRGKLGGTYRPGNENDSCTWRQWNAVHENISASNNPKVTWWCLIKISVLYACVLLIPFLSTGRSCTSFFIKVHQMTPKSVPHIPPPPKSPIICFLLRKHGSHFINLFSP